MKIDLIDIDNALKYYQISDIDYKNKCYKCVKDINLKNDFNVRTEEIYDILYTDKSFKIDTLWIYVKFLDTFFEIFFIF